VTTWFASRIMCKAVHGHCRFWQQFPRRGQIPSPPIRGLRLPPLPARRRLQRLGNPWQQPRNVPEPLLAASPTRYPRIRLPTDPDGTSTGARPVPSDRTPAKDPGCSSTSGSPNSRTASITVDQPTPSDRAAAATDTPSSPTRRAASRRARSESTALGRIRGLVSDQDFVEQAASGQRHSRFDHTNTVGRPPTGRSRTLVRRRPLHRARVPQPEQPTTDAVVSASTNNSPSSSVAARRRNPTRTQNRNVQGAIVTSHLWPSSLAGSQPAKVS